MRKLFSSLQRKGKRAYVHLSLKAGTKRTEHFRLKIGQVVVVEGGPISGKTKFLRRLREQLTEAGEPVVFVDTTETVTKWLKEVKLPVSMPASRALEWRLANLPERFYLLVDNADRAGESQKLEVLLAIVEKARSVVVATRSFSLLPPRLQARFREAKILPLGCGADTFDATYVVIAVLIVIVALAGYHHLVFLAAAIRYLFQGMRLGGRKL